MKQFVAPLAEPLGAIWLCMALGVLWLLCRRQRRCAVWLFVPTLLLFLAGSTPLAEALVAGEEGRYAGARIEAQSEKKRETATIADAAVSLGGGVRISHEDALGFTITDGGSRVLAAVELVRLGKARLLVLGGSSRLPGTTGVPAMSLVQDWLSSWRMVGGGVTNLGVCANTHDEAIALRKLMKAMGWKKILLVTSALHMRRAEGAFKKEGIDAEPVAADFQVCGVPERFVLSPFPRIERLYLLSLYLHEKFGWWVYRARGWV